MQVGRQRAGRYRVSSGARARRVDTEPASWPHPWQYLRVAAVPLFGSVFVLVNAERGFVVVLGLCYRSAVPAG